LPFLEAIYWWQDWVRSDANPGIGGAPHDRAAWHRTGIEVDQQTGEIIASFFDGAWKQDDDSAGQGGVSFHDLFYFRGVGGGERLWIDNLWISESDAPRSSRGAAVELREATDALPSEAFKNENMQEALGAKIDEVREKIEELDFTGAGNKLYHDVLKKTDGCDGGQGPDPTDWIVDCATQGEIRPRVESLLDMLDGI